MVGLTCAYRTCGEIGKFWLTGQAQVLQESWECGSTTPTMSQQNVAIDLSVRSVSLRLQKKQW